MKHSGVDPSTTLGGHVRGPKGREIEARMAKSGGRVLGEGAASPSPPARGSGGAL